MGLCAGTFGGEGSGGKDLLRREDATGPGSAVKLTDLYHGPSMFTYEYEHLAQRRLRVGEGGREGQMAGTKKHIGLRLMQECFMLSDATRAATERLKVQI